MPSIGEAPCQTCTRTIPIKENERGTQNWSCGHCDVSCYVKKGTEAHRLLQPRIKRAAPPPSSGPAPQLEQPQPEQKKPAAARMPWMPQS